MGVETGLAVNDGEGGGFVKLNDAVETGYPEYVAILPTASTQYEVFSHKLVQLLLTCGFRK